MEAEISLDDNNEYEKMYERKRKYLEVLCDFMNEALEGEFANEELDQVFFLCPTYLF